MSHELFHLILFPVDFSEASEATAPHVRALAELTGASVVLLYVVPWLSGWYGATEVRPPVMGDAGLRNLEEEGIVALETFREQHFPGINCHREVMSGAVAETITDRAANWGADLIMMPTRGLGRSRPFLIGSTTAKVLHDACCAVWTSPHMSTLVPFHGYKTIVCTVDRHDIPRGYIEEAARVASYFKSRLIFATAVPGPSGAYRAERPLLDLAAEYPLADVHQIVDSVDCSVISDTGSVGDVIRKIGETHHADLVLTNRGHLQHPFGNLRTHVYEIVLESPCPVLSLCVFSQAKVPSLEPEANLRTPVA